MLTGPQPSKARVARETLISAVAGVVRERCSRRLERLPFSGSDVVYFKTGDGVLEIEVNPPDATVTVDGNKVEMKSPRERVSVVVGEHTLTVEKHGFEGHRTLSE